MVQHNNIRSANSAGSSQETNQDQDVDTSSVTSGKRMRFWFLQVDKVQSTIEVLEKYSHLYSTNSDNLCLSESEILL